MSSSKYFLRNSNDSMKSIESLLLDLNASTFCCMNFSDIRSLKISGFDLTSDDSSIKNFMTSSFYETSFGLKFVSIKSTNPQAPL